MLIKCKQGLVPSSLILCIFIPVLSKYSEYAFPKLNIETFSENMQIEGVFYKTALQFNYRWKKKVLYKIEN